MGCYGRREEGEVDESQKWAYVTLSDFRATGFLAFLSYAWLWFLAIVAVAVYAADTFTAVNLLAFDKWSSEIQPAIPFKYSKWIFAVCIIISWALCGFEWIRAIRVIRRGGIAESYMDPLAVTLQSMRPNGGWKRFLVFASLTKSKKGVDYIALFVYFNFKGAVRVILASGARQVVNALTLYSVMKADLVPTGSNAATDGRSDIEQFFVNIETLANTSRAEAITLFTMLFTLCIWVVSAISLIAAVLFYLVFLWHYIPKRDGSLSNYCRRKIDRRLEKIVGQKVKLALEDQERKRRKAEAKENKGMDVPQRLARHPTLPQLIPDSSSIVDEKDSELGLSRQDSKQSLSSSYTSRPPTRPETPGLERQATLPDLGSIYQRPGMPSRSGTQASALSNTSYSSNAPLMGNAHDMGYSNARPQPFRSGTADSTRPFPSYASRPPPMRSMTQSSLGSQRALPYPYQPDEGREYFFNPDQQQRIPTPQSSHPFNLPPSARQPTPSMITHPDAAILQREPSQPSFDRSFPPPTRSATATSFSTTTSSRRAPSPLDLQPGTYEMASHITASPLVSPISPVSANSGQYIAFNPSFAPPPAPAPPRRVYTNPTTTNYSGSAVPQRSVTAPPTEHRGYNEELIDAYGRDSGRYSGPNSGRSSGDEDGGFEMQRQMFVQRREGVRSATAGPWQRG